jgi:hypothetical protein
VNEAVEPENLEAVGTCFEKGSRDTQEPLVAALLAG